PDRATPVRVAAEERRRRLRGLVVDARRCAVHDELERESLVVARERAQAVRREKLVFVEDARKDPLEPVGRDDAEQAPSIGAARERVRDLRLLPLESVELVSERRDALELLGTDL